MESTLLNIKHNRIKGLLKEQEENNNTILKNNLLDLGVILDGTFTFGTGITAFLPIVRDLINQQQPHITEQTIGLLYITAMWIILNRHGDKVKKLIQIIREQGLTDALAKVIDFLKSLEDVVLKVADEVGYAASTIADVGAFTFLAFPLLDGLTYLIGGGDITFGEPSGYLKSVLISVGILSIKNVFNSVIRRLRSRFGTLDESQHIMRYDDLGISSDVLNVVRKTLFVESEELWVLPQDVNTNKKYNFNELPHNIDLHISRNSKLKENYIINITKVKANNFKVILEINPLSEPKVYKNIKLTLKECFGKYGYSPISLTLNEQSQNKTIRTVFDNSNYKILVPLTMKAFCELSTNTLWCKDEMTLNNRYSRGTNYIVINKTNNKKTLVHDSGRVFLLRDGNSNYTVMDSDSAWPSSNIKEFLSKTKKLSDFFNVSYTATDKIKYGRDSSDEELLVLAATNNFSQAVYDVMNGENDDILLPYLGDAVDIEVSYTDAINTRLEIKKFGVSLSFEDNFYLESILDLEEEDEYYYNMAMGGAGDYHRDDLEWEELDFLCDRVSKSDLHTLVGSLQLLDSSINTGGICEEGVLSELLTKYFEKEWDYTGNDILSELGMGLAEYRASELKKWIQNEQIINADETHLGYELDLSYSQLLGLISQYNLETFSDLIGSGFNEIGGGLNDMYYDEWGYPDETEVEVSRLFGEFVEKINDSEDLDMVTRKNNHIVLDRVVKDLGFEKDNYKPAYNLIRIDGVKSSSSYNFNHTSTQYQRDTSKIFYQLSNFDPIKNTILLYVGNRAPYGNYQNLINQGVAKTYRLNPNEISDYVVSDDLFVSES
tara:strand:+ start:2070 stop:4568 length:2499 start_codon:yes stop_codon:yes gene_type:complete